MEFKDYYKILGVDNTADNKTIKTAYRRLARKYHPDVSKADDAEDQFKAVAEAYEVLGKADKRAEYDQLKEARERPQQQRGGRSGEGASDQEFEDFFSSVFGGRAGAGGGGFSGGGFRQQGFDRQGFERKGRDVEMEWPVMLEDTLSDKAQTIDFSIPTASGAPQPKTLKVRIPAGVGDGERIRLKGQGAPGTGSAPSGDLYLHIRLVPHPMFDVEGRNLVLTLPLAPWEAALGGKVKVPTLEGEVNLAIPKGSQAGQRLRLKGKGLSEKTDNSVRGDLLVQLRIVMPRVEGSSNQTDVEALWQQLAEKAQFDPRAQWRQPS